MEHYPLLSQFKNRNVFITGHTGFKGTWLTLWLKKLGANVIGYSLPAATNPSFFKLAAIKDAITHIEADICDYGVLKKAINTHKPDIVFHLAAQAIVLDGYKAPKETFDINAGGTVNVLEAIRSCSNVQAAVIITTDKCYENKSWLWGYKESDHLGGYEPYSASKSMAELATAAYRASFFQGAEQNTHIASARAGNIIGGGDFSDFRIVPDSIRALLKNESIKVRHPNSTRPWLYVLDALYGYLHLGASLLLGEGDKAEAFNFGPQENRGITVKEIVEEAIRLWGHGSWSDTSADVKLQKEMALLRLNWDKAANKLGWKPEHSWQSALKETIEWYRLYSQTDTDIQALSLRQIQAYENLKKVV